MWRVLFVSTLVFLALLQQLLINYKEENSSIYSIIKDLYRDKFTLSTQNQKLQFQDHCLFSLDLNIPFSERLNNFITTLKAETNIKITFAFQEEQKINQSLFLQFLISEIIKKCLSLLLLTKWTEINITISERGKEYASLMFVCFFHSTHKININSTSLKQIINTFNGKYKSRKYRDRLEIEILLPIVLD